MISDTEEKGHKYSLNILNTLKYKYYMFKYGFQILSISVQLKKSVVEIGGMDIQRNTHIKYTCIQKEKQMKMYINWTENSYPGPLHHS